MGPFLYLITILIEHSPIFTMAVVPAERSVVRVAVPSVAVTVASSVPEVLYIATSVPSASPLRVITPPRARHLAVPQVRLHLHRQESPRPLPLLPPLQSPLRGQGRELLEQDEGVSKL